MTRLPLFLTFVLALLLGACAQTSSPAPQAAAAATEADDDAYCRAHGGPVGSNGFAACLKDRDTSRIQREDRMDRAHLRNVESMLKP